jgi:hypothetical protein
MNPLIQFKQKILPLLMVSVLGCFGLSPMVQAVLPSPTPDGGYPGNNTAEGDDALFDLTNGRNNTALGFDALTFNTTGSDNTATGVLALGGNNDTGSRNTATGYEALDFNDHFTTDNTATGKDALREITTSFNTATGAEALHFDTGFSNTATGEDALFAASGNNNTATGFAALGVFSTEVTGSNNTATGEDALFHNTSGGFNTANGWEALEFNNTGFSNVATGFQALFNTDSGNNNTAIGSQALVTNEIGNSNTAIGFQALFKQGAGVSNTALGFQAGANLANASNNIYIGSPGVAGESSTTRIGDVQTKTFIAGINGATASGGVAVFVNSSGQLGTLTSSARFKDEIKPMDKVSEAIFALKPVTFRYKKGQDPKGIPQFGLVAEEVEKVNPDLIIRDAEGKPYSVRYEAVNAMLLNEFLKEHPKVQEIGVAVSQLEKEMDTLTAELREHAAQIQRVNDQLELRKPSTETVLNNQ